MPSVSTDERPPRALVAEALVTGLFLGVVQTALAFALLTGSGASPLLFFALTAAWIAGGALGAALLARRVRPERQARLLAVVLIAFGGARWVLAGWPFHPLASAGGLAAGAVAGCYAGVFLGVRASTWGDARRLLLHENNGFVAGIAAGGALLFASSRALDAAAGLLGTALLVASSPWLRDACGPESLKRLGSGVAAPCSSGRDGQERIRAGADDARCDVAVAGRHLGDGPMQLGAHVERSSTP
jgi:hypothetical protein